MSFTKNNKMKVVFIALMTFFVMIHSKTAFAVNVTLSWNPPTTNTDGTPLTDLAGYNMYLGTAPGIYMNPVDVGNVTTYEVANLTEGTTYYFVITAYDATGNESGYSNETSITIPPADDTPPEISGVYASDITTDSATINWTTDEPSDSRVQYGTTLSYGLSTPLDTLPVSGHSQTISGLAPSTQYNYRVLSSDASGNQAVSGNHTLTTAALPDTTPPAISNIEVKNITASSATITWTTDEPSTSRVEYGPSTSYGTLTPLDSALVTLHSVDLAGLSSYSTYDFRVRSVDAAGNGAVSANFSFTTSNRPPVIHSFSATPVAGTLPLFVEFAASTSDPDGAIVSHEWDFDGDGTYDENSGAIPSTTHLYTVEGAYTARLRVTDDAGASTISSSLTVTVDSPSNQPPVVSSLEASPSSGTVPLAVTFTVSASDPDGSVVLFEWDFDGNGTFDASTQTNPASHTYPFPGTYRAKVRVRDNGGAFASGETVIISTASADSGSGSSFSGNEVQQSCFIATAAYGSSMASDVVVLREFRDEYLLTNPLGRIAVSMYYRLSPPLAKFISQHEAGRSITRAFLTPVVYGIRFAGFSFGVFLMLLSLAIYIKISKKIRP